MFRGEICFISIIFAKQKIAVVFKEEYNTRLEFSVQKAVYQTRKKISIRCIMSLTTMMNFSASLLRIHLFFRPFLTYEQRFFFSLPLAYIVVIGRTSTYSNVDE
jgi:hypothetical protein